MTLFTSILNDETVKHVHTKTINFEAIGPREKPRFSPLGCPKHEKKHSVNAWSSFLQEYQDDGKVKDVLTNTISFDANGPRETRRVSPLRNLKRDKTQ